MNDSLERVKELRELNDDEIEINKGKAELAEEMRKLEARLVGLGEKMRELDERASELGQKRQAQLINFREELLVSLAEDQRATAEWERSE
jgi:chromosome segregation ATPase